MGGENAPTKMRTEISSASTPFYVTLAAQPFTESFRLLGTRYKHRRTGTIPTVPHKHVTLI